MVESGEGWLSPTDEAAGPKHHSMHTAEIKPMSAARMRAANKAAVEREWSAALRVQWEEQRGILKPMWEEAFDSQEPENQGIGDYRKWVDDGRPGSDAVAVSFWPYEKSKVRGMDGYSKLDTRALDITRMVAVVTKVMRRQLLKTRLVGLHR